MKTCEKCGQEYNPMGSMYDGVATNIDLVRQTPKEVWQQYLEDGYTFYEARDMERSYA